MQGSSSRAGALVVIRSSDGAAFPLEPADLLDLTTLERFRTVLLSRLLEIPNDCLILMNDKGVPLHSDKALLQLFHQVGVGEGEQSEQGGGEDEYNEGEGEGERERRLYVFDREHLDADPELVALDLKISQDLVLNEPPLNPQDPLTSHLSLSIHNFETLRALINSIKNQRSSLSLALANLHRVNCATLKLFETYQKNSQPIVDNFENLLRHWQENMDSIKKVKVVNGLLVRNSSAASSLVTSSSQSSQEKQRYLGDYVSAEKMMAVRDGCAKILVELTTKSDFLQSTLDQVLLNTEQVEQDLRLTSQDLQDLQACQQDAEQGHSRIEELVRAGQHMSDSGLLAQCFEELSVCDAEHRDRIRFLIERKNAMTRYLLIQMQTISLLQSDIAPIPRELAQLEHDLSTRTENFKHLARLQGFIPSYIATVAEVIRRKEFNRLVSIHSSSLSSMMKPLSEMEFDRRKRYRLEFSGKLPWEVRGLGPNLDELVPEIKFEVDQRGVEGLPRELNKQALEDLRSTFKDLIKELPPLPPSPQIDAPSDSISQQQQEQQHPLVNGEKLLNELIQDVDQLTNDFNQLALSSPPRAVAETTVNDDGNISKEVVETLQIRLRQLEDSNEELNRQLQTERSNHEEVLVQLENRCSKAESAERLEREKVRDLEKKREEIEKEVTRLDRCLEEANLSVQQEQEKRASEGHEVRKLRDDIDKLEKVVQDKEDECTTATREVESIRGRLSEKEKELGALKSEADLDRALFERELEEVRKLLETRERDIEHQTRRSSTLEEIADGLREQIARWEAVVQGKDDDLEAMREEVEVAQREKEKGIVDVQKQVVKAQRQARSAVIIAAKLRDENDNITKALNSPPPPKTDPSTSTTTASEIDRATRPPPSAPEPLPSSSSPSAAPSLDYASGDIDELLRELEQVSHVPLTEAIRNKMDGLTILTKKWVKEAKAYRERAHRAASGANDKIAFRHFTKGDLALFLPTRNSTVPVWAAFNVSFPHHFLSPTGIIAEQMKTREWIVARITSLSETIVDAKDPSTNPYLLAPGTKFFLLEVEPWSSKESSRARKHSSDKDKDRSKSKATPSRPTRSSSEANPSTKAPSSTADSAVLVDRPVSRPSPTIRRTVSEGFPQASSSTVRSEYAIVEVEEPEPGPEQDPEPDSLPPSPPLPNLRQSVPTSLDGNKISSSPSGLTRALARSQPPTPSQQKSDPFTSTSPSPSSNPFQLSASPVVGSPLRQTVSSPVTDYDPSHSMPGASPAFLPSVSRKNLPTSTSPSLSASTQSPRYIRSSPSSRKDSRTLSNTGSRPSPSTLLASSPGSSSVNSLHGTSQPRSASSGSSILSSSMHRRALSGLSGISPSLLDGKSLPTKEAQLNDSRWNLLQDGLVDEPTSSNSNSKREPADVSAGGRNSASPRESGSGTRVGSAGLGLRGSSASTSSVFDLLTGKNRSTTVERKSSTPPSSSSGVGKMKKQNDSAESEIRKLLGQPQF